MLYDEHLREPVLRTDRAKEVFLKGSLAIVALTPLLILLNVGLFFAGWQSWMWLLAAVVAEFALVGLGMYIDSDERAPQAERLRLVMQGYRSLPERTVQNEQWRALLKAQFGLLLEAIKARLRRLLSVTVGDAQWRSQRAQDIHGLLRNTADKVVELRTERELGTLAEHRHLQEARQHVFDMHRLVEASDGAMRENLLQIANNVSLSVEQMTGVLKRIHEIESDDTLHRRSLELPRMIKTVERKEADESDPEVKRELSQQLRFLRDQQTSLQTIMTNNRRASTQLESTVARLGSIYLRMQLLRNMGSASGRGARLTQELEEDSRRLQDYIESVDELQKGNLSEGQMDELQELEQSAIEARLQDTQ